MYHLLLAWPESRPGREGANSTRPNSTLRHKLTPPPPPLVSTGPGGRPGGEQHGARRDHRRGDRCGVAGMRLGADAAGARSPRAAPSAAAPEHAQPAPLVRCGLLQRGLLQHGVLEHAHGEHARLASVGDSGGAPRDGHPLDPRAPLSLGRSLGGGSSGSGGGGGGGGGGRARFGRRLHQQLQGHRARRPRHPPSFW